MTYSHQFESQNLASRANAGALRQKILESSVKTTLYFSNVETISSSYADELFGVICNIKGYDWLTSNISLVNPNQFVLKSIAEAIDYRLNVCDQVA